MPVNLKCEKREGVMEVKVREENMDNEFLNMEEDVILMD